MAAVASAATPPHATWRRVRPLLGGLYGLLGLVLLAYLLLLVMRPAVRDSLLLNGWGSAAFEIVVSLLVLARGLTTSRDRIVPLALGTGMLMWALGDVVLSY